VVYLGAARQTGDDWQLMPRLTDLARVRSLLDSDRGWSAYAIGDLGPDHVHHCTWHASEIGPPALLLLYRGFDQPILFAMGESAAIASLVSEVADPVVSLHVQESGLSALSPRYSTTNPRAMWRMVVGPLSFRTASTADVVSLDASDLAAITKLYSDGWTHDEGPTFFHASMLDRGTFRGIREGADIIAVAGSHLFSPDLGVCTIGNVYTRRDRRGRGLAAAVTSAVVQHALAHGISTIVLNVGQDNMAAQRVYERLGFHRHCQFFEGEAKLAIPGR
jgi:ribosomal protein S18 acetylase RimI-like enzyme